MSEKTIKLLIVVKNNELIPYITMDSLVETINNLAEFIVNNPKVVCLSYDPEAKKDQWAIGDVALSEIAKAIIERGK